MFWKKKKNKEFRCSVCGEIHNEWPALAYASPSSYFQLTEEEKNNIAKINDDFCIINYEDQTDRFIRVVLKQKIVDYDDILEYGLWVSLSEKSFKDYKTNFKNTNHENQYFGWLSNYLPDYTFTKNIPTTVVTKTGNERPEIFPHKDFDDPFIKDYYNGITKKEAEKRIHEMLKNDY
ncbi:DUF2199 domain-containing protein [Tenacibaculum agarivorans]|uniref:DUF2199 domain-containing protein n=1 Tax=Tenacibaculum agarivorans TaxID=1908389 RepID=UPI00094B90CC|nr:DUF2199 domain-containing protein [Tenacibaculum agarivorans]